MNYQEARFQVPLLYLARNQYNFGLKFSFSIILHSGISIDILIYTYVKEMFRVTPIFNIHILNINLDIFLNHNQFKQRY